MALDPRLTPAWGEVAADFLEGRVRASTFARGAQRQIGASRAALRASPRSDAEQVNQALFGETMMVYHEEGAWRFGQLEQDGYVGWIAGADLAAEVRASSHRVRALRTFVFERPDLKSAPVLTLSMNAKFSAGSTQGAFIEAAGSGWLFSGHATPLTSTEPDFVAVAERFVGAPYLWGGRDSLGVDCSGLVQMALEAAGVKALRDSDMQAGTIGRPLEVAPGYANLRRGDLIFWTGHVGIMLDAVRLLHANAWHMATEIETLASAIARIRPAAGEVKVVRRLEPVVDGATRQARALD